MEQTLYEAGAFKSRSAAVSLGGVDDIGKEMDEDIRNALLADIKEQGRKMIYQPDFGLNLQQRLEVYQEPGKDIKCFINVGGNLLSSGGSEDFTRLKTGLINNHEHTGDPKKKGLIQIFLDRGTPVINLLNIESLAVRYGIPIDPFPIPEIGEGDIFYEYRYSHTIIVGCLVSALLILLTYGRRVRR
jgi:poly-gamma-glutamate system protein